VSEECLREEVTVQIAFLDVTVREVCLIRDDLSHREPTLRDIAAAAGFLADFYGGIENILKRICVARGVVIPAGEEWHRRLFQLFCEPGHPNLPLLIDRDLMEPLAAYRRFRHIVHHSYVIQLRWSRMAEGVREIDHVYAQFREHLRENMLIA
jgi:hypothetical protein